MPASLPSHPDDSSFALSAERYAPRLLLWVYDKARGQEETPVYCAEFGSSQSIPLSVLQPVVAQLSAQGLIRTHDAADPAVGGSAPVVSLLASGVARASRLQTLRLDVAERGRHTRRAVLHWISAQTGRRPLLINGFFDSPDSFFLGSALTGAEVARCLDHLARAGLITCQGPLFHGEVGSQVALTPEGVDAVLSGSDVDSYLARQRERERENERALEHARVHAPQHNAIQATNVTIAGRDSHSHSTVHSRVEMNTTFTPEEVLWLLARLAPQLAVDGESRQALLRAATPWAPDAEADADADGGPDGDLDRPGLIARLRDSLSATPDTMGRQVLLNAADQVLGRLLGG